MKRKSMAIVLAAILAALLLLGVMLPLLSNPAMAAWYDELGPGAPDLFSLDRKEEHNGRYFENFYDADKAADMGEYHGVPVIYDITAELGKDGNVKLVPGVRYRKELTYVWQAFSDNGTAALGDDGWVNLKDASDSTFRPADFLMNGTHMVRLLLAHSSYGTAVSVPIVITITDGAGENEGFTGSFSALALSARNHGYYGAAFVTDAGLELRSFEIQEAK